jgi:hypothetical protein
MREGFLAIVNLVPLTETFGYLLAMAGKLRMQLVTTLVLTSCGLTTQCVSIDTLNSAMLLRVLCFLDEVNFQCDCVGTQKLQSDYVSIVPVWMLAPLANGMLMPSVIQATVYPLIPTRYKFLP